MSSKESVTYGIKDQLHAFHRYGDLALLSNEGIIFKVDSKRLSDVSHVFKSMIEIGAAGGILGEKRKIDLRRPLEVDTSSRVLEAFMEMITVMNPQPPKLYFYDTLRLFEFCDKFDISSPVYSLVKKSLTHRAKKGGQWCLLIWSAERNDHHMVKIALQIMTDSRFLNPRLPIERSDDPSYVWKSVGFWEMMKRLPDNWQMNLLELTLKPERVEAYRGYSLTNANALRVSCNWQQVAESFIPKR
ncbi:uncharacterized protein IL334_000643 [Kwoniella shivajii]|uniref:BTB domain-containing protein n=1 Tax=Kwoniella shivajii TaxID=564305 RepID=A0ABZ1CQ18_9TREE|nr:hypothetical protein IL334_000643 [Kwoniella shivajii]